MNLLYKLLKQDPDSREGVVTATSMLGIIVNLLIAGIKVAIGLLSSSIAVLSEGVNNAADAATSILTLVGTKLAGRKPTKEHPFGYGRIEYLTSLVIAVLIIVTGFELFTSSIDLIFHPAELDLSYLSLGIVAVSAVVKYILGAYTIRTGNRVDSSSLVAVGTECRNDAFISVVTILSSLAFILFNVSVDAYAGIFISIIVLKAGYEIISDTVSDLLGSKADKELADQLYKEIRSCDMVISAADMMLHNYGPDAYSGSVNIEIDHSKTVEEVYAVIHEMQLRIMEQYHVTMVFGIYAVDNNSEESRSLRREIAEFVRNYDHVISYHALFISHKQKRIYCDLIVDYDLADWKALDAEFETFMHAHYPDYQIMLTIETEFV